MQFNVDHIQSKPLTSLAGFLAVALLVLNVASAQAARIQRPVIEEAVRNHVNEMIELRGLNAEDAHFQVDVLQIPGAPFNFKAAETADEVTFKVKSSLDKFFSPQALVRVRMVGPEGRAREVGVPIRITLSRPVWVAKTIVMPGTALTKKDFRLETREINNGFDRVIGSDFDLNTYAARVMLRPGQILNATHVQRPPAVRRNSMVKVLMKNNDGMRIVVEGHSMQDGQVGQLVRVRSRFDRNKFYTGKVVGDNRVVVNI